MNCAIQIMLICIHTGQNTVIRMIRNSNNHSRCALCSRMKILIDCLRGGFYGGSLFFLSTFSRQSRSWNMFWIFFYVICATKYGQNLNSWIHELFDNCELEIVSNCNFLALYLEANSIFVFVQWVYQEYMYVIWKSCKIIWFWVSFSQCVGWEIHVHVISWFNSVL